MLVLRERVVLVIMFSATILGCAYRRSTRFQAEDCSPPKLIPSYGVNQLEISDPHPSCCPTSSSVEWVPPHEIAITQLTPDRIVGLSLQEAIQYALTNSPVLRELGGTILRAPQAVFTRNDPAIVYNDPRFGEEAALAEFDATLNSALLFENNDRRLNNRFFG
ncbi:MAG: hypothetical protein KGQ60_12040, partial [Planctomycetes bacterium]|nr:hypothetical protein [Planctomycetota bacterium]